VSRLTPEQKLVAREITNCIDMVEKRAIGQREFASFAASWWRMFLREHPECARLEPLFATEVENRYILIRERRSA
jgi:hypothetical protein